MVEHEHDLFRFESLSYVLSFHVDVLKGFCTFNASLPRGFVKPHVENMWPKTGDILVQLFLRLYQLLKPVEGYTLFECI